MLYEEGDKFCPKCEEEREDAVRRSIGAALLRLGL